LESFPDWLRTLATDAGALATLLDSTENEVLVQAAARGLTYLSKSLDLIPDGLEELGYVDDAFVLRVAAARVPEAERAADESGTISRLAADAELVREFLSDDYTRLETFVDGLGSASARGRSAEEASSNPEARGELASDVRAWAAGYQSPTFSRDAKNLVKLHSFMMHKLP
jgi:uncharacterized membrane protein YkvA (DUF1232 family)